MALGLWRERGREQAGAIRGWWWPGGDWPTGSVESGGREAVSRAAAASALQESGVMGGVTV